MKSLQLMICLVAWGALGCLGSGCGSSPGASVEDSSTSGSVASVIGGAYNSSKSDGTLSLNGRPNRSWELADLLKAITEFEPSAWASLICPTIASGSVGNNCSVSGTTAALVYGSLTNANVYCTFPGGTATWNGTQNVAFGSGTSQPACGAAFPTGESSIGRTFSAGTRRISASGTSVYIDTDGGTSGQLCAFSGSGCVDDGGQGTLVSLTSGVRTGIDIHSISLVATGPKGASIFNHVITTNSADGGAPIVLSNDNTIQSGTVVVYHNLAKVKAVTTVAGLTFSNGCCLPTGGTISTTFSGTGVLKGFTNGATESLQLTGCGTGTYTGPENYSGSVTLAHCF